MELHEGGVGPWFASNMSSDPSGPGLSRSEVRGLADWYIEEADRRRVGCDLDQEALGGTLRQILAERGVFSEFVEIEFERAMKAVFSESKRSGSGSVRISFTREDVAEAIKVANDRRGYAKREGMYFCGWR